MSKDSSEDLNNLTALQYTFECNGVCIPVIRVLCLYDTSTLEIAGVDQHIHFDVRGPNKQGDNGLSVTFATS